MCGTVVCWSIAIGNQTWIERLHDCKNIVVLVKTWYWGSVCGIHIISASSFSVNRLTKFDKIMILFPCFFQFHIPQKIILTSNLCKKWFHLKAKLHRTFQIWLLKSYSPYFFFSKFSQLFKISFLWKYKSFYPNKVRNKKNEIKEHPLCKFSVDSFVFFIK